MSQKTVEEIVFGRPDGNRIDAGEPEVAQQ